MGEVTKMTNIPKQLTALIPAQKIMEIEDWWEKLSKENQLELESIYKENTQNEGQLVSIQFCGKFVEQETEQNLDIFWINHLYEYLVNQELIIDETMPPPAIACFRNEKAENAIRNGMLLKEFICPESNKNCLMKEILNIKGGEKSLQFYVKFTLEKRTK